MLLINHSYVPHGVHGGGQQLHQARGDYFATGYLTAGSDYRGHGNSRAPA